MYRIATESQSGDGEICGDENYKGQRHIYIGSRMKNGRMERFCYQCGTWMVDDTWPGEN